MTALFIDMAEYEALLQVRLTEDVKERLREAAEDEDMSASELVRGLIGVYLDWRNKNNMAG